MERTSVMGRSAGPKGRDRDMDHGERRPPENTGVLGPGPERTDMNALELCGWDEMTKESGAIL
jgi:hypothetical protein